MKKAVTFIKENILKITFTIPLLALAWYWELMGVFPLIMVLLIWTDVDDE